MNFEMASDIVFLVLAMNLMQTLASNFVHLGRHLDHIQARCHTNEHR
jgi:hypothetical protein